MNKKAKQIIFTLFILSIFAIPFKVFEVDKNNLTASISEVPTLAQVLEKRKNYTERKQGRNVDKILNILIVPGHDDEHWGTEFKDVREVDLNRQLAENLYQYLSEEEGINAVLVSGQSGYNSLFQKYFQNEQKEINSFIERTKKTFSKKISEEEFAKVENNFHNVAPNEVRYKLYGINQWVNEKDFDLVIHIHFNDYGGRKWNRVGEYEGFSIYTPGKLFTNYQLSRKLADSVFAELKKIRPVSTLEEEQSGVIEDHELIALGANESLEAGSILIEYGYIYEDVFMNGIKRDTTLDYMAYATYAGIKNMLREEPKAKESFPVMVSKYKTTKDNLVWQFQKALEGIYPPKNKTLKDCPITGYFGDCSLGV